MDVKNDIAHPIPPPMPAGPAGNAGTGLPDPSGGGAPARIPDNAPVQKVLREALSIEPVANRELRIEFANDLHMIVVKVLDKESGEVIRQIPIPESLAIARRIRAQIDKMAGEQRGIAVDQEV